MRPPVDDPSEVPPSPEDRRTPLALRRLLRSGDHGVVTQLFAEHHGEVFASALRLTGSRASAEDVTSETFLVAWRQRGSVELTDTPLRGWLLAIAAKQSMNVLRGRRRRLAFLGSPRAAPGVVEDFADATAERLDSADLVRRTRRALTTLSDRELQVLSLCVWSGLSYREAADALAVPVGTVRSRLNRARERLRAHLAEEPDDHRRSSTPAPPPLCTQRGLR